MIINLSVTANELKEVVEYFNKELKSLRIGKVSAEIIGNVQVDAYGAKSQLNTVAQIIIEDAVSVKITPWDRSILQNVDIGLREANLGASVSIDKDSVRLRFNPITQEDRQKKVKELQLLEEDFKVRVRQVRQKYAKILDSTKGVSEDEIEREKKELQKAIDNTIAEIEKLSKNKSEELVKV